jgi:hypothetical protein
MRVKKLKCGAWTTSLQGYVESTYNELVEIFGTPTYGPDSQEDKVSCEWILDIDGTVCTIYDYKTKGTPYGKYNWHIGGRGKSSELMVKLAIQNKGALIK